MPQIALVLFVFYIQTSDSQRDPDVVGSIGDFDTVAECQAFAPKLIAKLEAEDHEILGITPECREVPEPASI